MHCTTNSFPYSLVLSRTLPGPPFVSATTDQTPNATDIHSTQSMQKLLQNRIIVLCSKLDPNVRKSQSRCKLDYHQRICKKSSFKPGSYVFLENPNFRTVPNATAEANCEALVRQTLSANQRPVSNNKRTEECGYNRRRRESASRINRPRRTCIFFVSMST